MAQAYEHVRLVIADPNQLVRTGLRAALFSIGFRTIADTADFVRLHDMLQNDEVDLLVASSELSDNDVGFLIQEMRNQRLGSNPFVLVIGLLANAEPDYVKRVIDSGVDDLLLTPVVPDQLISRIEKLARTRKPFVVTHDYTGPDRRAKVRSFDSHSAPMLEVPNPLNARATGLETVKLMKQIRESGTTLNRIKIERHAVQIDWLVSHISASIRDGMGDGPNLIPYTHRLVQVCEDMILRMKETAAEAFADPVRDLLAMAQALDEDTSKIAFPELEKMLHQSRVIGRSLGNPTPAVATPVRMVG
ncbi:MAG TPA: response regulator [Candidatus Omnitrophota bacterium]|nr:response regulator [Candidatus Omnitrophota bacterium]